MKNKCQKLLVYTLGILIVLMLVFGVHSNVSQFARDESLPSSIDYYQNSVNQEFFSIVMNRAPVTRFGEGQTVGVVDTPIFDHPELKDRLTHLNGTGHTKKITHGTQMARLVGSETIGLAPKVNLLSASLSDDEYGEAQTQVFAEQTKKLVEGGVCVVLHANNWGEEVLFYGANGHNNIFDPYGILQVLEGSCAVLVMAAGNQGANMTRQLELLLAQHPKYGDIRTVDVLMRRVVFVGSYDIGQGRLARYSNYVGEDERLQKRFLVVPDNIRFSSDETLDGGKGVEGTSFAAAAVAGAMALLMAEDSSLDAIQAADFLLVGAVLPCDVVTDEQCSASYLGQGMLDIEAAMKLAKKYKKRWWCNMGISLNCMPSA